MPMSVTSVATAGEIHPSPFVGPINHTVGIKVDVSALTSNEVDANGYLKPGVILQQTGAPIGAPAQIAYGAVVEAVKVHTDNTTLAGVTADVEVAVGLYVLINRDIVEDSLGRALSADELSAVNAAGSHVAVTPT